MLALERALLVTPSALAPCCSAQGPKLRPRQPVGAELFPRAVHLRLPSNVGRRRRLLRHRRGQPVGTTVRPLAEHYGSGRPQQPLANTCAAPFAACTPLCRPTGASAVQADEQLLRANAEVLDDCDRHSVRPLRLVWVLHRVLSEAPPHLVDVSTSHNCSAAVAAAAALQASDADSRRRLRVQLPPA